MASDREDQRWRSARPDLCASAAVMIRIVSKPRVADHETILAIRATRSARREWVRPARQALLFRFWSLVQDSELKQRYMRIASTKNSPRKFSSHRLFLHR